MSETWEPGTVGVATVRGEKNVLGMWVEQAGGVGFRFAHPVNLLMAAAAEDVTDFRPTHADVTEPGAVREVIKEYMSPRHETATGAMATALRKLLPKPATVKPEEPQRLLARVKLRDGRTAYRWTIEIAAWCAWRFEDSTHLTTKYDSLDVVEILSEGVEP